MNVFEKIITAISDGLYNSLNETAGSIYDEKWEKFLTDFQKHCQDMFYNKKCTEFTVSRVIFEKYGIQFPGKNTDNELLVLINGGSYQFKSESDKAMAGMDPYNSILTINSKLLNDKRFNEILIHEFTHGLNSKAFVFNPVSGKKHKINQAYNYTTGKETQFSNSIRYFDYLYNETEQNARISALGEAVWKVINRKPSLINNINQIISETDNTSFINGMQRMYNAMENGKFGSYERYKQAEEIMQQQFDEIQLREVEDIVYLVMHAKSAGQYFMFFKLPPDVHIISNKSDYEKVYDSFVEQTRKQLENFKKRMHKVINHTIQKYNENISD